MVGAGSTRERFRMGDYESRLDEARDIAQEAAEAGVTPVFFMLSDVPPDARCPRCGDEGWIDVDQQVPEVGMVAQMQPCPDCTEATCPECAAVKHGNCDGTAWSEFHAEIVDCTCEVGHG
jgi:hypothetical protein